MAIALAAGLLLPMIVFHEAYYVDWANHLYVMDREASAIRETGVPTYFLNALQTGLFYPHVLFYGGTLYALGGYLAVVVGSSWLAYVLLYGMGLAMSYGGVYWVARQVGVDSVQAHLPALVVVTSAYYLTNAYGRGAWPEFIATSSLPLVIASGLALLKPGRARARNWALLVASGTILTGSHNITLLWGTLVCAAFVLIAALVAGPSTPRPHLRRVLIVAGGLVTALAINAWFLIPDLTWASSTEIYTRATAFFIDTDQTGYFNKLSVVFFPGRTVPILSSTPQLYVQAPVFPLAWGLVVSALALPHWKRPRRAVWVATVVTLVLLLALVLVRPIWDVMPGLLKAIQFQLRLHTYVVLCVAALMILGLLAVRGLRHRRLLLGLALLAVAANVGLGLYQVWSADRYGSVDRTLTAYPNLPPTFQSPSDFRTTEPVAIPKPRPVILFSPDQVVDGRLRLPTTAPGIYSTNIVYSKAIAGRGGLRIVGRDPQGFAVVEVPPAAHPEALEVVPARPTPVLIGRILSVLGVLAAIAVGGVLGWQSRRRSASVT